MKPSCTLRLASASLSGRRVGRAYINAAATVFGDGREIVRRTLPAAMVDLEGSDPVELPRLLAEVIELEFAEMWRPDSFGAADGHVFIIPPWWFGTRGKRRVEVRLDGGGHVTKLDAHGVCRSAPLRVPHPSEQGVLLDRARRWAVRSVENLTLVTGHHLSETSTWLLQAAEDPTVLFSATIRAWREMLDAIDIPRALRFWPTLVLGDLPYIVGTKERRIFATHWPWAANALAHARPSIRRSCLQRLDSNRANSVSVASQMLCCQGRRECSRTTALARKLPTIDPKVQSVVFGAAGDPHSGMESACRAALFEVEAENETALADRIARADPHLVLSQVEFALQASVFSGPATRLAVGGLVASMLVGTEIRPQELGVPPATIGRALRKASADSVAVFAATNRPLDDPLDAGIYALSKFFRRHRLGATQMARWAATVSRGKFFEGNRTSSWPPPRGWRSVRKMTVSSDARPLLSIVAIVQEGMDMKNCLARGHYHDSAAAGLVHIFSLRTPQRATLALREHRDETGCRVVGYEIVELKAHRNETPESAARQRAEALVTALHEGLLIEGAEIGLKELQRRGKSTRSFIADAAVAVWLWKALVRSLPVRFHGSSPEQIAEEALAP